MRTGGIPADGTHHRDPVTESGEDNRRIRRRSTEYFVSAGRKDFFTTPGETIDVENHIDVDVAESGNFLLV
jgi:hypothetical protein